MLHHPNVNSFSFSKQTNNPHIHHSSSSGAQIIYESVAGIGGAAITTAANSPGDFMNGKLLQNRQSQRLISEKSQLERPQTSGGSKRFKGGSGSRITSGKRRNIPDTTPSQFLDIGFETHQLKPSKKYDIFAFNQQQKPVNRGVSINVDNLEPDTTKMKNREIEDNPPQMSQSKARKGGSRMSKTQNHSPTSATQRLRLARAANKNRSIYQGNQEGSGIIVLTSKIGGKNDGNSSPSGNKSGSSPSKYSMQGGQEMEQLSTDETEVRQKVQQIENNIQERALNRYRQMVESGKSKKDMLKVAKQINDITFKYRVQNGGSLAMPTLSQRYPNEVRVKEVAGLDVTPMMSENDKNITFEGFMKIYQQPQAEKVRQNFPALGSGTSHARIPKYVSIIHDAQQWTQFSKHASRLASPTKESQVILQPPKTTAHSPKDETENSKGQKKKRALTASHKEKMLLNRMEEARKNFLKNETVEEEVIQVQNNVTLTKEDKMMVSQEIASEEHFLRSSALSNRLRMISRLGGDPVLDQGKPPCDLSKWGFEKTSTDQNPSFDPLRLKIMTMPVAEANPVGKNADYFFLKGFKDMLTEDYAHAMASYLKGLNIKQDHLLCRYNLGVILFTLGLYDESRLQYHTLVKQGYGDRPIVQYNKALSEMQAGRYVLAIESSYKCIDLLIKQKNLFNNKSAIQINANTIPVNHNRSTHNNSSIIQSEGKKSEQPTIPNRDKEMLADMHNVQGLCYLRSNQNMRKAGRCFEDAKAFKVERRSELMILVQKCIYKLVQAKLMDHIRRNAKTQQNYSNEFSLNNRELGKKSELQRINNNGLTSKLSRGAGTRNRAQSAFKIYLTDLDVVYKPEIDFLGAKPLDDGIKILNEGEPETQKLKRSRSLQPLYRKELLELFIDEFEQQVLPSLPHNKSKQPTPESPSPMLNLKELPSLDDMTFPQVMDQFKTILSQKADPEQCYLYIDDEHTVRLDKLLNLPNSFETKKANLTEKEQVEKMKREAIELYLTNSNPPQTAGQNGGLDDNDDFMYSFFNLRDRLSSGIPDQKHKDNQAYNELMVQIKKFNQKLDLSLNYFLSDHPSTTTETSKNNKQKLESEVEQGIKMIKHIIVEQANKKPEVSINRLKLQELESLDEEMNKENKLDRDIKKIENLLLKLKSFKILNPHLRQLVILRSTYKKFEKNEIIYKQGEEGHCYYYLLRGSVTMLSKRSDFGNFDLFIRSFYDGDCFGEQPQLFAKQESQVASEDQLRKLSLRDSNCIANEDCLVLEVSNAVKHEFYRNDSSNQYERCLYWLRKNPIFRLTEGFYLLQMIFNIEKKSYVLGEALVRAGEVPEGMFIITSGQCKAVFEGIGVKPVGSGEFSRFQKKPKNFVCGVDDKLLTRQKSLGFTSQHPEDSKGEGGEKEAIKIPSMKERHEQLRHREETLNRFNADISAFNSLTTDPKKTFQSTRIYLDDDGKHMPQHVAFQDNIEYGNLVPGDSFGSRVLLPDDEITKRMKIDPMDLQKAQSEPPKAAEAAEAVTSPKSSGFTQNQPALTRSNSKLFKQTIANLKASALSVIADSREVEVLILRPSILIFLPEQEKDKIYEDLARVHDPDKPQSLTKILQFKNRIKREQEERMQIVQDIRKAQYMDRHKGVYKR